MTTKEFDYRNAHGKMVRGAAATSHQIFTVCGGLDGFLATYAIHIITAPIAKLISTLKK